MRPWQRRFNRELVDARREVKQLVALAAACAAEAEKPRADARFRPLNDAESEAIVGAELVAVGVRRA